MSTALSLLADDDCYLALKAKDARFDGRFFTGVTSTGIYCRPVCRVRTPLRKNCRFFGHAAQAESAGFRPCLRCRPELAPHSVAWCIQDASYILAHQAARLLDETDITPTLVASRTALPPEGATAPAVWQSQSRSPGWKGVVPGPVSACGSLPPEGPGFAGGDPARQPSLPWMEGLADRLGVSSRHLRRIFDAQFGVTPLQYLQTRRLLTARQLLADTDLPITQVAFISGFASVRRFNAAFAQHYRLNPTQQRRQGTRPAGGGIILRLGYRPPYDVPAMLAFLARHCIDTLEFIAAEAGQMSAGMTLGIESGGKLHTGWLLARFDEPRCQLVLQVSESLLGALPGVIRRVRALFDLDADPAAINRLLGPSFPGGDGRRVPGAIDGFRLAIEAVLGQQVTVAAARTLGQRLVNKFGAAIDTPWPRLSRLFPTPAALAAASSDALGQMGIIRQRQAAIVAISQAVADKRLLLNASADVNATVALLKALPGIGDWTAQYIAMRALRWPDAFPAGDVALQKALGLRLLKNPARLAEQASSAWKPWRSYAVIRAWGGFFDPAPAIARGHPAPFIPPASSP